jgi:hypothetical protein
LFIRGANGDTGEVVPMTAPASAYNGWLNNSVGRNVARIYALIAQDIRSSTLGAQLSRRRHASRDD